MTTPLTNSSHHPMPHEDASIADEWHQGNMRSSQRAPGTPTPLTAGSTHQDSHDIRPPEETVAFPGPEKSNHDDSSSFETVGNIETHDNDNDDDDGWEDGADDWSEEADGTRNGSSNMAATTNEASTVHTHELYYDHSEQPLPEQAPDPSHHTATDSSSRSPDEHEDHHDDRNFIHNENEGAANGYDGEEDSFTEEPESAPLHPASVYDNNNKNQTGQEEFQSRNASYDSKGGPNPAFLFCGWMLMLLSVIFSILAIVYRNAGSSGGDKPRFRVVTPPPQAATPIPTEAPATTPSPQ
ncbi:expressed unknown protein [Seminavis robusta]|uniref:Uncharacterized protein n=1 Tax=Seminavis robusta TaxID=568900 RepID=A0A9N8EJ14_9STRA|nr:expressed unknown protein [Seminavis robusta]|eukprot:Sro1077_g238620.1 n/a (297) ;mRNA; r:21457-22347